MGRVIAIQGFAPDSRDGINREPASVERWGMNNGYKHMKDAEKAVKWFQIHPQNWNTASGMLPAGEFGREEGHAKWLSEFKGELYMLYPDERVPNALTYPYAEVNAFLGLGRNYITSSFAFAIGLALYEHHKAVKNRKPKQKIDQLKLFGINLSTTEEYFNQRPCVEFMLGIAKGMGIKVEVPATTAIFRGEDYALTESNDMKSMLRDRIEYWRGQHQEKRDQYTALSYVVQELRTWQTTIGAAQQQGQEVDVLVMFENRLKQLHQLAGNISSQVEGTVASYREAQHTLMSVGGAYIPETEFPVIKLADAPIGYSREDLQQKKDSDAGTRTDSAGLGANIEPVATG